MRKLFPVAVVALVAILTTSCSKSYNCTCKISGFGVKDSTVIINYKGISNSAANTNCKNAEEDGNASGYSYFCHL